MFFSDISDNEAEVIENGTVIKTTEETCSCSFFTTNRLPCAHLFAFWIHTEKDTFRLGVCDERWFICNNKFASDYSYIMSDNEPSTSQLQIQTQTTRSAPPRRLGPIEKFRKADNECKRICEILAEKSQSEFDEYMQCVVQFRGCVESGLIPG